MEQERKEQEQKQERERKKQEKKEAVMTKIRKSIDKDREKEISEWKRKKAAGEELDSDDEDLEAHFEQDHDREERLRAHLTVKAYHLFEEDKKNQRK